MLIRDRLKKLERREAKLLASDQNQIKFGPILMQGWGR
ncbi:hypothetical protein IMCC12053_207 [Celeribacter marinus]|uniref:Uncharacterized protein n=1 Tax=Celeribacter marinus TaxID=1397108 RepID=A0A0N7HI40_9RHOB|nr:hypothetical protein IMCC12053_207 [Celeribacter marinus]